MKEAPAVAVVPDDYFTGTMIGMGLLGAEGSDIYEARENRLLEIERRILAIEDAIRALASDALLDRQGNGKEGV